MEEELFDGEDESASDEAIMSQPNEEEQISPQGQAPRAGGITLGGEPVDTALPAGWGKPERKSGRVGEWTAGQGNAWPGG